MGRLASVVIALASVTTFSPAARANDSAPGDPALGMARGAWDSGHMGKAEPLYREALEKGGLAPPEVLEAYVRLGTIRAVSGKKAPSIAAFRAASVLDARFTVPKQGGKKASALAAQAKQDTAAIGSIRLSLEAPDEAAVGKPFTVTATLDAAHVPIIAKIGVIAHSTTAKDTTNDVVKEAAPAETIALEIGPEATASSTTLRVRVDALDKQGNRLSSAQQDVRVGTGAPIAAIGPPAPAPSPSASAPSGASTSVFASPPSAADTSPQKRGFWSSPWPYVLGGIALAGASTALYFGTRPADQVTVGQVGVRTN